MAAARIGVSESEYRRRVSAGWKWCTACRKWQRRAEFGRDSSRGDGLSSRCRARGQRRSEGPGKSERRAWAAAGLGWCRGCENWLPLEELHAGLCQEHTRAAARDWYANGGWRRRQGRAAARRGGVRHLGPDTREWIFEVTGGLCAYSCGRKATSVDHVIPVARGGQTKPGNVVPACNSCNSAKRDTDPLPWIDRMSLDALALIEPGLNYDGAMLEAMAAPAA